MKRNIKNIIMILLLVVLVLVNGFTVYKAREYKEDNYKESVNRPYPMDEGQNNENMKPAMGDFTEKEKRDEPFENGQIINRKLPKYYYALFVSESLAIAIIIFYLLLSDFNQKSLKETFINIDKVIIMTLGSILLTIGITLTDYYLSYNLKNDLIPVEENKEKDTKKEDIDKGDVVNRNNINLDDYQNNITITKAGEYNITGSLNESLFIDADGKVTLNLDGVQIENNMTAAIANISENDLIINLIGDNYLTDGGSSEYDAALYSEGNLLIKGDGKLTIYGRSEEGEGIATEGKNITIDSGNIYIEANDDGINAGGDGGTITINAGTIFIKASGDGIDSNKDLVINGGTIYTMGSSFGGDAGIDTDGGYKINGGNIIALGSDMLESPLKESKQKTICFTLNEKISKDTLVTLLNDKDEVIISFATQEDFKTLIISNEKIENGIYSLYIGGKNSGTLNNNIYEDGKYEKGEKVKISNKDEFTVNSNITMIK